MSDIEDEPPSVLLPCAVCSRTFRPEVLERHVKVCEKTASKKRRVFDSFKSRVSGTELEEFLGPAPLPGQAPRRPSKSPVKKRAPSKWKETHENLIATLRAARGVEPPPDVMIEAPRPAGNERCPSCNRYFGPRAFDRHVEFCKEKTARIKLTPSKVSQAQERLEARTKYRAPLSIKPKLTTKEKYSPMPTRKESNECFLPTTTVTSSTKTSPPIPTMNRKLGRQNSGSFSRQSPIRHSERQRSISPLKKNIVSSSKSSGKSEAPQKSSNQPKVKENLRNHEDLKPRTGSKASTQDKNRTSYPKLSQLEDENQKQVKIKKTKTRERIPPKTNFPSDNESIATIESGTSEEQPGRHKQSKWSSVESLEKTKEKHKKKKHVGETEKVALDLTTGALSKSKGSKEEAKSEKKSKQQKHQINDLSVNDESFGIFVAACTVRPSSSSASGTSVKPAKESKGSKVAEKRISEKTKKKTRPEPMEQSVGGRRESEIKFAEESKPEKTSKIPKPKAEAAMKKIEKPEPEKREHEVVPNAQAEDTREEKIKKKSRRWRNVTEIPTEELEHLSEDFEIPKDNDAGEELSETAIWEIAAEQFLNSDDVNQTNLVYSVDSLNEDGNPRIDPESDATSDESKKIPSKEDELIFLHVTDPSKLVENDADIKFSVSEPCFSHPSNSHILKDKTSNKGGKRVDIVVFTAYPNAVQPRITHRKRRKERKKAKSMPPELLHIREKTFLANDLPKTKRQKLSNRKAWPPRSFEGEHCFEAVSKEKMEERKKKFIDGLRSEREKIRKWQISANSHMRFMEEFHKSIENDLKELKNLSKGIKSKGRCCLKEFKKERLRKMKREEGKEKTGEENPKVISKGKKFEYFEISLTDDIDPIKESSSSKKNKYEGTQEKRENVAESSKSHDCRKSKKFECPEVPKEDSEEEINPEEEEKIKRKVSIKEMPVRNSTETGKERTNANPECLQRKSRQNSSLENIEEVEENAENEKSGRNDIEIEDFILSKPNTEKIFSKEENCLDELFPKPQKIAEAITSTKSKTAVQLDFTAKSVYDLKSNAKKKTMNVSPPSPTTTTGSGNGSTRILSKRVKKDSHLPQILVKCGEMKENSMMSLIEAWKCKKGSWGNEKLSKRRGEALPTGKLPPLANKNSFQIGAFPIGFQTILKEMLEEGFRDGGDSNDSYDPFKQAERQMLALLSWPSTADIQKAKSMSPTPKSKPNPSTQHLETSPTSAFTKYPNKDDKTGSKGGNKPNARRNLNQTFAMNEKNSKDKPTYTAADDWEQIFEKHFDLNRNEMTEQMTRSVKSALDGLLKSTMRNKSTDEEVSPVKSEPSENSVITDVLYTSTPKNNSKSDRNSKTRSKNSLDLDETPTTYRKNSELTYDSVTPPEDFSDSLGRGKKSEKPNRNSGISLSSLSFCSQISDTTLADEEVMRSNLEIIGKAAAAAAARTPRRKYARSQSVFDERNKMLFAKTYDPSSSDENDVEVLPKIIDKQGKVSPSRNPNPKSAPFRFSRSQSVVDGGCKGDGDHSDDGDHISSPESNRNRKAKLSGDSAYSSLNRRSPREGTQKHHQEDRLSSSGSEHSLPIGNDLTSKGKSLDFDRLPTLQKKEQPVKMSKFCHECGSKYPVAVAKFCCECGVRRLII